MPEAAEEPVPDSDAPDAAADSRPWAVYLLDCLGGRSYIGISPWPQQRFEVHRSGKGAAFTRANRPEALAAVVWFENRSTAASIEARLKSLARPAKLEWFNGFAPTSAANPARREDGLAGLSRRSRQLLAGRAGAIRPEAASRK